LGAITPYEIRPEAASLERLKRADGSPARDGAGWLIVALIATSVERWFGEA